MTMSTRLAAVGGLRPRAARPLPPARRQPARAGRGDGPAQRARPLHPPRRGRLDLGRARRGRSPPPAPTRRTRSSTRPPTSPTATRRSTTSRRGEAPVKRRSAHRTRSGSATTRWCSRSGWGSGSRTHPSSRRTSPSPTSRSTCSARPAPCSPTRAVEGEGRSEDDLAYLRDERAFRNVQLVEQPNGDFADHDRPAAVLLDLPARALRPAPALDRRDARRRRRARRSRRSPTTATTRAVDAAARRRHGRSHQPDAGGLDGCGRTSTSCSTPTTLERSLAADGVAVDAASLASRVGCATSTRCSPRRRWTDRCRAGRRSGGRQGMHTEPFGYLLAEMQHLHRATRGRHGERARRRRDRAGQRCRGCRARPRAARAHHRGPRRAARRDRRRRRPRSSSPDPDLLRLPGDGGHRRDVERAVRGARASPMSGAHRAVAGLDDRLDQPTRAAQAARATASRRRSAAPATTGARSSAGDCRSAARTAARADTRELSPLRLHRVQGAVALPSCREPFDHFKAL